MPRLVGTYVLAVMFAGGAAFPLYWMVVAALQPGRELFTYPPRLLPRLAEVGVFARLFATQPMLLWLANTVLIAAGVAVISVALAVLAAYALSRFRFAGRRGLQFMLLLTQIRAQVLFPKGVRRSEPSPRRRAPFPAPWGLPVSM